jgi:prevent-host-death family protein
MTRLNATKAREDFSDTLNRVAYRGERILLERRGKVVAAIVPAEDVKLLEELEDQFDLKEARKAIADVKKHGTVPWENVKAELRRQRQRQH